MSSPSGNEEKEEEGKPDVKSAIHRVLENHWLEIVILILVFVDIGLVSVEAGIDFEAICIKGEVVPFGSPAGAHLAHHEHGHGSSLLGEGMVSSALSSSQVVRRRGSALGSEGHLRPEPGPDPMDQVGQRVPAMGGLLKAPELRGATLAHDELPQQDPEEVAHQAKHPYPPAAHTAHSDEEGGHHESDRQDHHGSGQESGHADHHASAGQPDVLVCEGPDGHTVHHVVHTCHFWSIAILCIFFAELLLKIWVIPGFIRNPFHKLDCVVVLFSLLLDTVGVWLIHRMKEDQTATDKDKAQIDMVAGLLLLIRFWRVVRIVHGLYEFGEKEKHVSLFETKSGGHHGEESL